MRCETYNGQDQALQPFSYSSTKQDFKNLHLLLSITNEHFVKMSPRSPFHELSLIRISLPFGLVTQFLVPFTVQTITSPPFNSFISVSYPFLVHINKIALHHISLSPDALIYNCPISSSLRATAALSSGSRDKKLVYVKNHMSGCEDRVNPE